MARPGTDIFKVNVRGAGRAARDFDRLARAIQDEINAELREFGVEAEAVYRDHAPKDTRQLAGNIAAVPFFRASRPRLRVLVEPLEGHGGDRRSYIAISRRGHRRRLISPRRRKALKVHTMGHRNPHIYVFRASVEGSQPSSDWVSRAEPAIDSLADAAQRRLGRRIQRRAISP